MVELETKLSGDLESGLRNFFGRINEDVLKEGGSAMAQVVADELRQRVAPPYTGEVGKELQNAVYYTLSEDRSTEETKAFHVGINRRKAFYWYFLEYGTSKMAARPMVRPAFDSKVNEAVRRGIARMKEVLGK